LPLLASWAALTRSPAETILSRWYGRARERGGQVKIVGVETILVSLPSDGGAPPDDHRGPRWTSFDVLLVRVDTDEGISGWGEAFGHSIAPATKVTIDGLLAPMLLGADPADIAGISHRVTRALHMFGRNGTLAYGLSGIDIALWDIAGKVAGAPLHRLLGGAARHEVDAYASLLRFDTPALVAAKASEAVAQGFRHVKLHETTVAAVAAARDAVGDDVSLMLDPNCAWSAEQGLDMARDLAPFRLRWTEDAVWPPEDHYAIARLRRAGLRMAAGENTGTLYDFARLFDLDAVDVAQPDVTKVGGLTEMTKVIALAEARNVFVSPHSACYGPGFLATVHAIAAMPYDTVLERMQVGLGATLFPGLTDAVNGRVPVPQGPGLGADPDPEVIERYRVR
jgi:L-alanine-DL-glutamate epimerase-like enolase superfamily enzyme